MSTNTVEEESDLMSFSLNVFEVFVILAVEQNQRALKQAVSVIEAIGDHSTLLQISNFMKSEDSLQGQVILLFNCLNIN